MGYTCKQYGFSDSNDLSSVTTTAADESDVIYVPTDNTVANNTEIVNNICQPAGVPIIAGEEGICKGCGVATLSISYYDLGVATGKMAVKILNGESDKPNFASGTLKNQSDYDFSLGFYPAQEVPSAAAMMSNQPPNLFYCSTSLAKIAVEGNEKI